MARWGGGIDIYAAPSFVLNLESSYVLPLGGLEGLDFWTLGVGLEDRSDLRPELGRAQLQGRGWLASISPTSCSNSFCRRHQKSPSSHWTSEHSTTSPLQTPVEQMSFSVK